MRTVVDVAPTWLLVLAVVGSVVGLVLLSVWAVRRGVPSTREGFDAEVSSQVLGVVASLFGLLLAFVVVIEFQAFSAAEDNVAAEADDVSAIVRDSRAFSGPDATNVQAAVGRYVHTVVEKEWPLMRRGRESTVAWADIDGLFSALQDLRPANAAQAAFYDDAVRHLNALLQARRDRLGASDGNDLPP
jgi:hypothetical protein